MTEYEPDKRSPPGCDIVELMEANGLTTQKVAKALRLTANATRQLLLGELYLSDPIARRLEKLFAVPSAFWLERERRFRGWKEPVAQEVLAREPEGAGWYCALEPGFIRADPSIRSARAYVRGSMRVLSSVLVAEMPDGHGEGLQWHVSVSRRGSRPTDRDVERVRKAFGMLEAEEDNHHPGNARHLFLVVDPARRVDCQCKSDETVRVEPDGYTWSDASTHCRACEIAPVTGRACPWHGNPATAVIVDDPYHPERKVESVGSPKEPSA